MNFLQAWESLLTHNARHQRRARIFEDKRLAYVRVGCMPFFCGLAYCSRALLRAALASKRVESKVGRGVSSGRTINGISVQPRTTASHPHASNFPATSLKYSRDFSGKTPLTNSLKIISLIVSLSASSGILLSMLNSSNASE